MKESSDSLWQAKRDATVWRPYHLKLAERAVLLRRKTFLLVVEKLRTGVVGSEEGFPRVVNEVLGTEPGQQGRTEWEDPDFSFVSTTY